MSRSDAGGPSPSPNVPPARVARMPRQRDGAPRPGKPTAPVAPATQPRGMSRGMWAVFIGALALGAVSVLLGRCATDRGAAGKARVHWNAPPTATRTSALDELLGQATTRAVAALPGARLAHLSARLIDARGGVDLDYGSADFDFVNPGQTPCSVHLVKSWQGWAQRPPGPCLPALSTPRCTVATVMARAYEGKPADAIATLELGAAEGGVIRWSVRFRDLPAKQREVIIDDTSCAP